MQHCGTQKERERDAYTQSADEEVESLGEKRKGFFLRVPSPSDENREKVTNHINFARPHSGTPLFYGPHERMVAKHILCDTPHACAIVLKSCKQTIHDGKIANCNFGHSFGYTRFLDSGL